MQDDGRDPSARANAESAVKASRKYLYLSGKNVSFWVQLPLILFWLKMGLSEDQTDGSENPSSNSSHERLESPLPDGLVVC